MVSGDIGFWSQIKQQCMVLGSADTEGRVWLEAAGKGWAAGWCSLSWGPEIGATGFYSVLLTACPCQLCKYRYRRSLNLGYQGHYGTEGQRQSPGWLVYLELLWLEMILTLPSGMSGYKSMVFSDCFVQF